MFRSLLATAATTAGSRRVSFSSPPHSLLALSFLSSRYAPGSCISPLHVSLTLLLPARTRTLFNFAPGLISLKHRHLRLIVGLDRPHLVLCCNFATALFSPVHCRSFTSRRPRRRDPSYSFAVRSATYFDYSARLRPGSSPRTRKLLASQFCLRLYPSFGPTTKPKSLPSPNAYQSYPSFESSIPR